ILRIIRDKKRARRLRGGQFRQRRRVALDFELRSLCRQSHVSREDIENASQADPFLGLNYRLRREPRQIDFEFSFRDCLACRHRYNKTSWNVRDAVGNEVRFAPMTSFASVKYRSATVPVARVCRPVFKRPACPATMAERPLFLCSLASAC